MSLDKPVDATVVSRHAPRDQGLVVARSPPPPSSPEQHAQRLSVNEKPRFGPTDPPSVDSVLLIVR